ncbi:MAG: HAD family hydrolase [Clostridia bacterium]|nr:HAD family hydrolase [Clostridia bacterium]
MQNVQWLFFDLGSTLIDETDALARRVRETISGTNVRLKDFMRVCNARYAEGLDGYKTAVGTFHLSIAPWHSDEERPYHDAASTLQGLQSRGYRLGVIANQLPGTEQRLKHWGLLPFFDVVAASAECGYAKPDPEIFLYALRRAGCAPEKAVMIGDRVDNDLLPAKSIGMRTVRVLAGPFSASPAPEGAADATVRSLFALLSVIPPYGK